MHGRRRALRGGGHRAMTRRRVRRLLACAAGLAGLAACFSDQMRLWVEIDGACGPCCGAGDFAVLVDGETEAVLGPGETSERIERTWDVAGRVEVRPASPPTSGCEECPGTSPASVTFPQWGGDDMHLTYRCDGSGIK